ncbi:hypothetical protein PCAR4_880030 [Paraburkholderia caribensis]|nr:hypothetical protein PCAR4_880030 [Paraburkholderia caribensis]
MSAGHVLATEIGPLTLSNVYLPATVVIPMTFDGLPEVHDVYFGQAGYSSSRRVLRRPTRDQAWQARPKHHSLHPFRLSAKSRKDGAQDASFSSCSPCWSCSDCSAFSPRHR